MIVGYRWYQTQEKKRGENQRYLHFVIIKLGPFFSNRKRIFNAISSIAVALQLNSHPQ